MKLDLYFSHDGMNVVNKRKRRIKSMDISIRRTTDIITPTLILESDTSLLGVNYCYIEDLKRYYFVTNITPYPNNMYRLECLVDVLDTYKNYVLNSDYISYNTGVKVESKIVNSDFKPQQPKYVINTLGVIIDGNN